MQAYMLSQLLVNRASSDGKLQCVEGPAMTRTGLGVRCVEKGGGFDEEGAPLANSSVVMSLNYWKVIAGGGVI